MVLCLWISVDFYESRSILSTDDNTVTEDIWITAVPDTIGIYSAVQKDYSPKYKPKMQYNNKGKRIKILASEKDMKYNMICRTK
jgi:hypothetical protein